MCLSMHTYEFPYITPFLCTGISASLLDVVLRGIVFLVLLLIPYCDTYCQCPTLSALSYLNREVREYQFFEDLGARDARSRPQKNCVFLSGKELEWTVILPQKREYYSSSSS